MELYKKYRPKTLKMVVGNSETVAAIESFLPDNMPHAIMLHGPTGCGKTTLARIIAEQLGCHKNDYREINSAQFRGIDTIREVTSNMHLHPLGKSRVWLFDECHQISSAAQNGMLKILEDSPENGYFILCTTDKDAMIAPVRGRCAMFPVVPLNYKQSLLLLSRVNTKEQLGVSEKHLDEIAGVCAGQSRDMLVTLEKVAKLPEEKRSPAIVSASESAEVIELCRALIAKKPWQSVAKILKGMVEDDPEKIRWAVLGYANAVLLNSGKEQAYYVVQAFQNPFYTSKKAGLSAACYLAINGE